MHLAVKLHVFQNLAAVGFERASVIVQLDAADLRDQSVGQPRRQRARQERVFAVFAPAGNYVVTFIEFRQQPFDVRRIVLQIGVHRYQNVATRRVNSRGHRRRLAVVAAKSDDAHPSILRRELLQQFETAIRAAVVDIDHLEAVTEPPHGLKDSLVQARQIFFFVVYRQEERKFRIHRSDSSSRENGRNAEGQRVLSNIAL